MVRDTSDQTKPELALTALRKRICLADPTKALPLHEGTLAEEFGMSRTPIRQVLQRLAYERLVDIKSGVGTVAMPMDPANRTRDLVTHQGIVRAILAHGSTQLSVGQHSDVVALGALIDVTDETPDASFHFELRARLLSLLSGLIADPILRDAFLSAHWRVVRWHMHEVTIDPNQSWNAMRRLIESVASYSQRDSADLFTKALEDDLRP